MTTTTRRRRTATPGLTLPVPLYVQGAGLALGLLSSLLGVAHLTRDRSRPPGLAGNSVVAIIEPVLGWVLIALGAWVVVATLTRHARASAHAVAAVAHGAYLVALLLTLAFVGIRSGPSVTATLAGFALVAHTGECLAYWQRGYR